MKCQMSTARCQRSGAGFTLIEMLVVGLVVGILGAIATTSLISLLRGANKTEIIKEIKQNGDYALFAIEVNLRNSTGIISPCDGSTTNYIQFTNPDSTITEISCTGNPSRIRQRTLPSSAGEFLTNTSVNADCSQFFTCNKDSVSGSTTVNIKLTLTQAAAESEIDTSSSQFFVTQVTLRNR